MIKSQVEDALIQNEQINKSKVRLNKLTVYNCNRYDEKY